MISIIVCSRSADQYGALVDNINSTIGVAYEAIRIDNSANAHSICSAYNAGAAKANYPYLCFVHEDVLFETKDWGRNIIDHFNADDKIGLIGVAGATYKSKMSSAWWQTEPNWREVRRMNIVQHYKNNMKPTRHVFVNPNNESRSQVVTLDGVLLIAKKETWSNNKFDEQLLRGFHGYDLDFCLQVGRKEKIVAVYDVLLHHFSGGNSNLSWMDDIIKVHKKWKHLLPVYVEQGEPADAVYSNGLRRMRKNIGTAIHYKSDLISLIRKYNFFYSMLDGRPGLFKKVKDYCTELVKAIKLFYRHKSSVQ